MSQTPKKTLDNKPDTSTKDRGDRKSLGIIIDDLDIQDFLRTHDLRDRGDLKGGNHRTGNTEKAPPKRKPCREKKKIDLSKLLINKETRSSTENNQNVNLDETAKSSTATIKDEQKSNTATKDAKISTHLIDQPQTEPFKATKDVRKIVDGKSTRLPPPLEDTEIKHRTYLDYEGRRKLRKMYTVKLKSSQNSSKNINIKDSAKLNDKNDDRDSKKQPDGETNNPFASESSKDACQIDKLAKKIEPQVQRKPFIKTIRLSNDNRVYNDYKTVMFMDQTDCSPLRIKVPIKMTIDKNDTKENSHISADIKTCRSKLKPENNKLSEPIDVNKQKKKKEKCYATKNRSVSPITVIGFGTPQTEVAKWAPSCINCHTKPYYEAWVDTTLAAIAKCSEKDKSFFSKQNIIRTFKRALDLEERPHSPELVYEKYKDETYIGRIKVRTAKRKQKCR